ncbi:uncharacterized protein K444DRAFT_542642, partial [Hyaloscypha bicolor E]
YLLNSYTNVYLLNRPHYYSIKECLRSKGRKGFKKKNKIIRYGLIYNSPGYIYPFYLSKEYLWPDNL